MKKFEGAVVIVSHDEQLLSLACSQLWSVLLTRTPSFRGRRAADWVRGACVLCRHCDGEGGVVQLHYGFDEYKDRLRTGKDLQKK